MLHSTLDLEHSRACEGQFDEEYRPQRAVGKGAFGFVWQAYRRTDGKEVVVKFIRSPVIVKDSWVDDPDMGRVSQEIAILTRLDHRNIVKVLEVFDNELFFQMVMEKHGNGMDLFEFIEKQPHLDEPACQLYLQTGENGSSSTMPITDSMNSQLHADSLLTAGGSSELPCETEEYYIETLKMRIS
uniref:non-specific serine/threonine protein kinase n=1 Tax=Denticeps clupeoides TaxID=299321 RepID=A0AAY4BLI0_9TELE